MSQRGCLILCALILLPFLIVGLVRMGCKAARRAKYGTATPVGPGEREAVYLSARFRVNLFS